MSSSEDAGTLPALARPKVPEPLNGLDPDSFTAYRLHHATPQHLYLTTRRCFIGPIPEAWLSKHRKSWYRHRPHLSTYSSRTASFVASENVSPLRQLTGLDRPLNTPELSTGRVGLSFPQPDDASENGRVDESKQNGDRGIGPSSNFAPTGEEILEREEYAWNSRGAKVENQKGTSYGRMRARVGSIKRRKGKAGSVDDSSSFVTAQESLGTPAVEDSTGEANLPNPVTSGAPEPGISLQDSQCSDRSSSNRISSLGAEVSEAPGTMDSTSSLIPHKNNHNEGKETINTCHSDGRVDSVSMQVKDLARPGHEARSTPVKRNLGMASDHSNAPESTIESVLMDAVPEPAPDGTNRVIASSKMKRLEPISTGLVRFNVPDKLNDKKAIAQKRVSEAKGKASLQYGRKSHVNAGQLLKAERMLVRIDSTRHELPDSYSENDSQKAELKLVEKWRELVVVCRKSGDEDSGFVLQMSKTRVVPSLDRGNSSKKVAHEIPLTRHSTKINMYSSLDKTIVIWTSHKGGARIYIFRPRSTASSVEWLTFLNSALGWKRPSSLTVHVPDLNLNLELDNPFHDTGLPEQPLDKDGYGKQTNDAATLAEGRVAKAIIARSLDMLRQSSIADIMDAWIANEERIGLAWKRYDRLEWIHGVNEERMYGSLAMQKTHELELRPKRHYPTCVSSKTEDAASFEEPTPVEGFLVRLTSQKGRERRFGKTFFKKLYYSTHNQFLCFTTPAKAVPPKPPKLPHASGDMVPSTSEIVEKIPMIFGVNPFPIRDSQISWLNGTGLAKKKELDQAAFDESQRIAKVLQDSNGYINLCHVVKVQRARIGTSMPPNQGTGDDDANNFNDSDAFDSDHDTTTKNDLANCFELKLENGLIIRLQAFDRTTRKEWVNRLRKIIKYWQIRTAEDMDLYKYIRHTNIEQLDIDEEMESYVGQFAQKWEVARALASADLFNMCGIACCRSITMSGTLYRKPRLHSTFKRCSVIVCHGKLLIFQSTLREATGKEIPHIHHETQDVVDLKDTYVYSGLVTESDLLYHNQTFDSNHPGHHALPRVYLEDTWTSSDEDTATCFVVWHGKSKSLFKARAQQDDGKVKQQLRYVSSLGVTGRSMVFKTRSRAERDHWVMSIGMEIERLQQDEDIRVIPQK